MPQRKRSLLEILLGERSPERAERAREAGMRKARYSERWSEAKQQTPKSTRAPASTAPRHGGAPSASPQATKAPPRQRPSVTGKRPQSAPAQMRQTSTTRSSPKRPQLRATRVASPSQAFYVVSDGPVIRSIQELYEILPTLTETQFSFHANHDGNDFAAWIRDVFGEHTLADVVAQCQTYDETREVLSRFCYRSG